MNRLPLSLILAACVALGACGDDGDAPTTPPREVPVDEGPARVRVPDGDQVKLPDVGPLTEAGARGVLGKEEQSAEEIDLDVRGRMLYRAKLGDRTGIDHVRTHLLAKAEGEYEDPYLAAIGLEILLRYGEPDAADLTIELAEKLLGEDDSFEAIAAALAAVDGPRRERAEELLLEILQSEDDWAAAVAAEALVARGVRANDVYAQIARDDSDREDMLRASAIAGLLAAAAPEAKDFADAITHKDVSSAEIIDGFAIPGAVQAVPYIVRVVENAFDTDPTLEFVSACYALATIYQDGGEESARELIYGWLSRDPQLEGEEASYALWVLGDDARKEAVGKVLTEHVANFESYDPELAIDILDEIAKRGLANDPAFKKAVEAAAQVSVGTRPDDDHDMRVSELNAAAAHAFLRSQ